MSAPVNTKQADESDITGNDSECKEEKKKGDLLLCCVKLESQYFIKDFVFLFLVLFRLDSVSKNDQGKYLFFTLDSGHTFSSFMNEYTWIIGVKRSN